MGKVSSTTLKFVLFATFLFSCSKDTPALVADSSLATCSDGVQNGNETGIDCGWACSNSCFAVNGLEGDVLGKVILDNRVDYKLTGPLIVRDGMELEIREGTIIKAVPGKNAYIAVAQGGKIFVYGKEDNPVIMTSDANDPAAGDWGGLIICGKAPTNTGNPSRSETGDLFYGGDDPLDGSGVLRYLRIEYTGATFTDSNIFNGVSFYGVGSQTTIEHVQSYNGLGDGFGFYGGTVDSQWLMATKSGNNAFFITDGWHGTGKLWYASGSSSAGIQMANNQANPTAIPMTTGQISEVSIVGPVSHGALNYSRGGGIFTLSSIYVSGIDLGIMVGENAIPGIEQGNLNIASIQFDQVAPEFEITDYTGAYDFFTEGSTTGAGNNESIPAWGLGWTKGL